MQTEAIIVTVYGLLVLAGGVMGWVKAQSKPSLISGVAFGVLLLLSAAAMWQGRRLGLTTGAGLALGLLVVMGMRFAKTRKFMPAGFVGVMSAVVFVVLLMAMTR